MAVPAAAVLEALLLVELAVLCVLAGAAAAVLAGRWWDGRDEHRFRRARDLVLRALAGVGDVGAASDVVVGLPARNRRRLVLELVRTVGPSERPLVAGLAARSGLVDRARRRLRSRRWRRRLDGVRLLTAVGLDDGARVGLLDDRSAEVRAAAAWWSAVVAPGRRTAASLAARADDPSGRVRHALAESLARCRSGAATAVADLLVTGSDRGRRVALLAASGLHDPRVEAAARVLAADPSPSFRTSACRLLRSSADPATVAVLDGLLVDPDPRARAAAAASLGAARMEGLVDRLAPLVVDDDDVVRTVAADALVRLGPVGEMVVRVSARAAVRMPREGRAR